MLLCPLTHAVRLQTQFLSRREYRANMIYSVVDVDPDWNDKISAVGPNGGSECEFFL